MKKLNGFKKYFALIITFAMLLTLIPTNVFATTTNSPVIDGTKTGSLTINKKDDADKTTAIQGVTFTVYKVFNIDDLNGQINYSVNGEFANFFTQNNLTIEKIVEMDGSQLSNLITELKEYVGLNNISGESKITDINGKAEFEELSLGYYLVDETAYPDEVVAAAPAFLVSIPMTNSTGDNWIYDVEVSPKNITARTGVTLIKYGKIGIGEESVLDNVTFTLEKENLDNAWEMINDKLVTKDGIISVDNLTQGTYRFIETQTVDGYILNTAPIVFKVKWNAESGKLVYEYNNQTNLESLTIEVTNEKPTIDKEVKDSDKDVNIGDFVNWTINATVPTNINNLKTFKVTDTLSAGLTFNESDASISVKNGTKELVKGTDYILDFDSENNILTFDFIPEKLIGEENIVITYRTKLNENAVIGGTGNTNKVELEYSTSSDSTSTTKPSEPNVYTFGLALTKHNNENKKLAGAEFDLYRKNNTGEFEKVNDQKLVTDQDGLILVKGLESGSYKLVETKAPTGYNLLKEPVYFEITAEYTDGVLTATNTTNGYISINVLNNKGFQLPTTGGMGTLIFTIGGLTLMGIAAGAYVVSKRKESK